MTESLESARNTHGTLIGLVERFSPSGGESDAVAWLVSHMGSIGYTHTERDGAGNAVGVMGQGPRQIVLLGHIDTVPGQIPVRLQDGRLYGRGAVDAKGPLAAFVDAAARLGPVPGWQVIVIGAVDEERDSTGARFVVDRYRPEFAVIGEPSRWQRLTLGYKGSAWAQIHTRLPVAHSAGEGQNACETAVDVWNRIQTWAQTFNAGRERAFDQALPTLGAMDSGSDGFAAWARLRVGVRLPQDLPPAAWYAQLRQLAGEAQVEPTGYPIIAYRAEKNTPLVRAFLAGIRAAGGQPGFVLKTGTADLNIVAPVWGCPAIAYGPGDSSLDHTPDEHIHLDEYSRAVDVLHSALKTLTRGTNNM